MAHRRRNSSGPENLEAGETGERRQNGYDSTHTALHLIAKHVSGYFAILASVTPNRDAGLASFHLALQASSRSHAPATTSSQSANSDILIQYVSRVRIETVPDNADDWESSSEASDASSAVSSIADDIDIADETLLDRLAALGDIVPPSKRAAISDAAERTSSWVKWTAGWVGSAAWVVTTSALLVGLPLMLSIEGEAAIVEQEKQFHAQQPGAQQSYGGLPGTAPPPTGVVPAGF